MPIGLLQKAGIRLEGAESGAGLADSLFPASILEADDEEVVLGEWDAIPFTGENIILQKDFEQDETVEGHSGTPNIDNVLNYVTGKVSCISSFNHITQILALACGFEYSKYPSFENRKRADIIMIVSTTQIWVDAGIYGDSLDSDDIGKYIRLYNGDKSYQVRKITDVIPEGGGEWQLKFDQAWVSPAVGDDCEISGEFEHQFELSENLNDEFWDDEDADFPVNDIYTASDKIVRRATIGISKLIRSATLTSIFRSYKINNLSISGSAGQSLSITFNGIGFDHKTDSSKNAAPTNWTVENFDPLMFHNVEFYIASYSTARNIETASYKTGIRSFNFSLNNSLKTNEPTHESGTYQSEPSRSGKREITLQITTSRLADTYFQSWYENETEICALLKVNGSQIITDDSELSIYFYKGKITDYQKPISRVGKIEEKIKIQWTQPVASMTYFPAQKVKNANSEIVIKLKNRVFWNPYMDQNYEY
jgi:hypothetical protein